MNGLEAIRLDPSRFNWPDYDKTQLKRIIVKKLRATAIRLYHVRWIKLLTSASSDESLQTPFIVMKFRTRTDTTNRQGILQHTKYGQNLSEA